MRPNFAVEGSNLDPWQEDSWTGDVKIGEVVFCYNKPCTRCVATQVNPDTGMRITQEPLKTLKSFRQHEKTCVNIRSAYFLQW